MNIDLYQDQEELLEGLRQSMRRGHRTHQMQASTGFGKTAIAAKIIEGYVKVGKRVVMTAPYVVLINQTVNKFVEYGLDRPAVIWQNHELTDSSNPVQIASLDTLLRRNMPEMDLLIVDESHLKRKKLLEYIRECNHRVIGLSATPWADWMGTYYDDLIKAKSMRWLIDNGRLCDFEVFAATKKANLSNVRIKNTNFGNDYIENQLARAQDTPALNGDVVETWLEKGKEESTLVFCVNVAHAGHLSQEFTKAGVSSEVITAKTEVWERARIFKRFDDKITTVLISVGCLIAGMDRDVRNICYVRPTKSPMLFVQAIGRGLRTAAGKYKLRIFDHTNTTRDVLGFVDDIDYDELNNSSDGLKEEGKVEKKEKPKSLPKECKSCGHLKRASELECSKCGFKPIFGEEVETDKTVSLEEFSKKTKIKTKKAYTKEEKQDFYSCLLGYYNQKTQIEGKKWSNKWVLSKYRSKFEIWPRGLYETPKEPTSEFLQWIKKENYKAMKTRKYRKTA